MPNPIDRKRLKKKMLDRWENEGGSIGAEPADDDRPTGEHVGKGKQASASRNNSTVRSPASLTKRRKPPRK